MVAGNRGGCPTTWMGGRRCRAGAPPAVVVIVVNAEEYSGLVKGRMWPSHYPKMVWEGDGMFLLRRAGQYLFLGMPVGEMDLDDRKNREIKKLVRSKVTAIPVLLERGLFVHAWGPEATWKEKAKGIGVDRTALRPVIVQNVNFFDPESGASFNNRTSWGPENLSHEPREAARLAILLGGEARRTAIIGNITK